MKNINNIGKRFIGITNKAVMKMKKHAPEILLVAGITGTVASTVLACKATTKVSKIVEDTKEEMEKVHVALDKGVTKAGESYSTEDSKKDLTIIYTQAAVKITKLYAPAVIVGAVSIMGILASNNILRKRNFALAAAYTTLDNSFKDYRKRVIERFSEQLDSELKYGLKIKEDGVMEVDPETGEIVNTNNSVMISDPNLQSDYAVYFDAKSRNYENNQDYNLMFLKAQQQFANDKLKVRGHLFLNEVLDDLDLPRTPAGQIVGWTSDGPDGYVNFRIVEVEREVSDGVYEPVILLDFNVEGNVWEKM